MGESSSPLAERSIVLPQEHPLWSAAESHLHHTNTEEGRIWGIWLVGLKAFRAKLMFVPYNLNCSIHQVQPPLEPEAASFVTLFSSFLSWSISSAMSLFPQQSAQVGSVGSAAGSASRGCGLSSAWSSWEKLSSVCVCMEVMKLFGIKVESMRSPLLVLFQCDLPAGRGEGFLSGNECGADPALCRKGRQREKHSISWCDAYTSPVETWCWCTAVRKLQHNNKQHHMVLNGIFILLGWKLVAMALQVLQHPSVSGSHKGRLQSMLSALRAAWKSSVNFSFCWCLKLRTLKMKNTPQFLLTWQQ